MKKKIESIEERLSYREPMQVTEKILYRSSMDVYPICPRCIIPFEREYQAFCSYCGQKLKWRYYSRAKISCEWE